MAEPTFRRLARSDFTLLRRWLAQPHVARWWNHETSEAEVEADFGASVDGTEPTEVFIVATASRPFGLLQRYAYADCPAYRDELAPLIAVPPSALGIDYLIGEPEALGIGMGTAMLRSAVASIWRERPHADAVIVAVNAANVASWRALASAGFERSAQGPLAPDNPVDDPLHVVYRIDRPQACG